MHMNRPFRLLAIVFTFTDYNNITWNMLVLMLFITVFQSVGTMFMTFYRILPCTFTNDH